VSAPWFPCTVKQVNEVTDTNYLKEADGASGKTHTKPEHNRDNRSQLDPDRTQTKRFCSDDFAMNGVVLNWKGTLM
jgi:hypothetical protein